MSGLLVIPLIPAIAAVVLGLGGNAAWTRPIAPLAALASLIASLLVCVEVAAVGPVGLGAMLRADALSALELAVLAGLALATFTFDNLTTAANGTDGRRAAREACSLAVLACAGLALLLASLGWLVIALWATSLACAALAATSAQPDAIRDAWRSLPHSCIGCALALVAVVVLGVASGGDIGWPELMARAAELPVEPVRLAFLLALAGFGTTAALTPANGWVAGMHTPGIGPASLLATGALVNTSIYALLRFQAVSAPTLGPLPGSLLILAGAATVVVAAVGLTASCRLSELVAGTTIAQAGLVVFAAGLGPIGILAALHHTIHQASARALLVFGASSLGCRAATDDLNELGGAASLLPVAYASFAVGGLTLFGLPPAGPFASQLAILGAGIDGGRLAATFAVGAAISLCLVAFADRARRLLATAPHATARPSGAAGGAVLALLALLALLLAGGLLVPTPIADFIQLAASVLAPPGTAP